MIKRALRAAADSFGYTIERKAELPAQSAHAAEPLKQQPEFPADFTPAEINIWKSVQPYTMTSTERVISLVRAVQYVERYRIPGAFVECGVWRGGSMMAAAKKLLSLGSTDRELYLFDTFSGMPDAGEADIDVHGQSGQELLIKLRKLPREEQSKDQILAWCPMETVRQNLLSTEYPENRLHFVSGCVETTIPGSAPDEIALLRLDTDWYESTRHELTHLFPRLARHGVLIVDDYGHWQGARQAVDEFFEASGKPVYLSRVDQTGRIAVKC